MRAPTPPRVLRSTPSGHKRPTSSQSHPLLAAISILQAGNLHFFANRFPSIRNLLRSDLSPPAKQHRAPLVFATQCITNTTRPSQFGAQCIPNPNNHAQSTAHRAVDCRAEKALSQPSHHASFPSPIILRPSSVRRYFCRRLFGLSGMVRSMKPDSMAGFK